MKTTKSGLIMPDNKPTFLKTISDFPPVTGDELHNHMVLPVSEALAKGVPPESPTAIPLEAVCRMIRTIQDMAAALNKVDSVVKPMLDDENISVEVRKTLSTLFFAMRNEVEDDQASS